MKEMSVVKKSIITAVCLALCVVLPQAFHAIPNAGSTYLPMHIPVHPVRADLRLAVWFIVRSGRSCAVNLVHRNAAGCLFTAHAGGMRRLRPDGGSDDEGHPHRENLCGPVCQPDHCHAEWADRCGFGEGFDLRERQHHDGRLGHQLLRHQPPGYPDPDRIDPHHCFCIDEGAADSPALPQRLTQKHYNYY